MGGYTGVRGRRRDVSRRQHRLPPAPQEGVAFNAARDTLLFPHVSADQRPPSRQHGRTHVDGLQLLSRT